MGRAHRKISTMREDKCYAAVERFKETNNGRVESIKGVKIPFPSFLFFKITPVMHPQAAPYAQLALFALCVCTALQWDCYV
jgi:hypothetical protein